MRHVQHPTIVKGLSASQVRILPRNPSLIDSNYERHWVFHISSCLLNLEVEGHHREKVS